MVGRSNIHKPASLHFHIYCEKNHKTPSIFREEKYFNGGTLVVQAFGNCISSVRKWHSLWHGVAKWHSALQWHDSNTKKWLGHKYFAICLSKQNSNKKPAKNKKAQCLEWFWTSTPYFSFSFIFLKQTKTKNQGKMSGHWPLLFCFSFVRLEGFWTSKNLKMVLSSLNVRFDFHKSWTNNNLHLCHGHCCIVRIYVIWTKKHMKRRRHIKLSRWQCICILWEPRKVRKRFRRNQISVHDIEECLAMQVQSFVGIRPTTW